MTLSTLKSLYASGQELPITTLQFNLFLARKIEYNTTLWNTNSDHEVTLYYALSQEDITLDEQLYKASCFSIALPECSGSTFQDLTFSIGDTNREIMAYLSRILRCDDKNINTVTVSQWNPQTLEREYQLELTINSVHFSGATAQFTASFADMMNTEFPRLRYTAENAKGIIYVSN